MKSKSKSEKQKVEKKNSTKKITISQSINAVYNSPHLALIVTSCYIIVMSIISFTYHKIGDYGVETDFYNFIPLAKKIFVGEMFIHHAIGPVYILILSLLGFITNDFFHSGMIMGLLSSGVVLFFTFKIIELLFTKETALIATLLMAVNLIFVQYTYSAGSDMFFIALAAASVYYFLKQNKFNWLSFIFIAVLAALTYLTRYNGAFIIIGIVLSMLLFNLVEQKFKRRILYSIFTLFILLLVITPWGIHCLNEKGDFFYNQNYKNIVYAIYGEDKVAWEDKDKLYEQFNSVTDVILRDPVLFFEEIGKNIYEHLIEDMDRLVGWHLGVLILPGFIIALIRKPTRKQLSYYLFNLLFFGILLIVFYNPRFSMYLIPFYIVLALQALYFIRDLLNKTFDNIKWFIPVCSIVLIGWSFINSYELNKDNISSGPQEVLAISDWFNTNIPKSEEEKIIVARKPHIAYYLGMNFKWFPNVKTYDELIGELRKLEADYLFFSPIEASLRREFQYLLNYKNAPAELTPVVYLNYPPTVLYKINPM